MRKFLFLFLSIFHFAIIYCQVGIGTTSPKASAALEMSSNNKGLLVPRTSNAGRTGIAAPAKGLMVYDTTHAAFFYYDGGTWRPLYEKNYDSSTVDYYHVDGASKNMLDIALNVATGNSGFIYDNGGPAGIYNYSDRWTGLPRFVEISFDDSTLQIKITVEEMNTRPLNDSLYIEQKKGGTITNTLATFCGTQAGTVTANNRVRIYFRTYGAFISSFDGFKIRWGRLRNTGALQTPAPIYGWHFNNAKLAAMGGLQRNNNWHTDSVGVGSLSYGIDAKAKGEHSIAIGSYSTVNGYSSKSMGGDANGSYSTAMGLATTASGSGSTAMGLATTASGSGSTAMGRGTNANGSYSTAMGQGTNANGSYSTAMGQGTNANGSHSTAMGIGTTANGNYTYSTNRKNRI